MDAEKSVESRVSESLREQIQCTQAELGHKIETLENEVRSVAYHAKESVREIVDIRRHIGRHPVALCAVAVGAGFIAAGRLRRSRGVVAQQEPARRASRLLRAFAPEMAQVRAVLLGKAVTAAGEWFRGRQAPPESPLEVQEFP